MSLGMELKIIFTSDNPWLTLYSYHYDALIQQIHNMVDRCKRSSYRDWRQPRMGLTLANDTLLVQQRRSTPA